MRLKHSIKRLLACAFLSAPCWSASAEQCTPLEGTTVFFGNGITTDSRSADKSLNLLRKALGDTYNGQPLSYDLAYNQTDGMAADLLQAAAQAGAQWDSQIMGWLVGIGIAPDWFAGWYSSFMLKITTIAVPDLQTHVAKYAKAMRFGRKVLVVSHSQGNFYVNEAKQLLAQQFSAADMQSFGIFGVATPANNVGGAPGPYYTNHLDIIQIVPTSLPQNWTLRYPGGAAADDVARIQAHLFDTYMSESYDIRASLLLGIKQQLSMLQPPAPSCDDLNYRKQFVRLVAGPYLGTCDGREGDMPVSVDAEGVIALPGGAVDISTPDVLMVLNRTLENEPGFIGDMRKVNLFGQSTRGGRLAGIDWVGVGQFERASVGVAANVLSSACFKDLKTPITAIPRTVSIAKKASELMAGYRDGFAPGQCSLRDQNGLQIFGKRQAVVVEGTTLVIGDRQVDLAANLQSEKVVLFSIDQGVDTEPQFELQTMLRDGGMLNFRFKAYSGITTLRLLADQSQLICARPFKDQ